MTNPSTVYVNGEEFHLYEISYPFDDRTYSFNLYARNRGEAEQRVQAIRDTPPDTIARVVATIDGGGDA